LARTYETAKQIAKATGAEIIVDERLREVRFGTFEGSVINHTNRGQEKPCLGH